MPSPHLNTGFNVGPKTLIASPGKYGILAPSAVFTLTAVSGVIKFNPGQYGASNTTTSIGNGQLSQKQGEIALVRASPAQCLGYQAAYFWNVFINATANSYDFSTLDSDYIQCVSGATSGGFSGYFNPRRFGIFLCNSTVPTGSNPASFMPSYITGNAAFGASPTGGSFGWWTKNSGAQAIAALWRSSVMGEWIKLIQALAAHVLPDGTTVDTSPYVEAIFIPVETASCVPDGSDVTFSGSAILAQLQAMNAAAVTAFPHTSVVCVNNFLDTASNTQTLENTFGTARVAAGGPDLIFAGDASGLSYGQEAYIGNRWNGSAWVAGGTDLRGVVPYIGLVQGTEMGYVTQNTPAALWALANSPIQATHLWWSILAAGDGRNYTPGNWLGSATSIANWIASPPGNGVLNTIVNSPLSNTIKPSRY